MAETPEGRADRLVTEGFKDDDSKPPVSLVSGHALLGIASVMGYGALKYTRHNYRLGMQWTRLVDAAMRHLIAFNEGEDDDPESGLPHLAHAGASVCMLMDLVGREAGTDDRFGGEALEKTVAEVARQMAERERVSREKTD